MPLIYCETNRIKQNEFELVRSEYVGLDARNEIVEPHTDVNNDRLYMAILNVGFACKYLGDREDKGEPLAHRVVGIESDIDGKDSRNGGEHDILFALLVPKDDEYGRKMRSLYYDYERYLSRILQLSMKYDIKFVLQVRGENVRYNN